MTDVLLPTMVLDGLEPYCYSSREWTAQLTRLPTLLQGEKGEVGSRLRLTILPLILLLT